MTEPLIVEKTYKYRMDNDLVRYVIDSIAEHDHRINAAKVISIDVSEGWATIREAIKP